MRALEPWHLIVLLLVLTVLFGGKRLPEAARGLGRSMRIFKSEVKELRDDDEPKGTGPLEGRVVGDTRAAGDARATGETHLPTAEPVRTPDERRPGL